ncbi:MAG: hypothetical protein ACAI35_18415 [Candidatus Methylacidiphilales bacterium]|nr:hypothetical protein [Candidatus Methylacidiphilales bacterium]
MTLHWFRSCPLCDEGKLYIYRNKTEDVPYLNCEECEWGWYDPREVDVRGTGFLTLAENFDAEVANINFIQAKGWNVYNLKNST